MAPDNAEFFITFRLANSLPKPAVEKIKSEKHLLDEKLAEDFPPGQKQSDKLSDLRKRHKVLFQKYERQLDQAKFGPAWLSNPSVAKIVGEAIHYRNNNEYDLYAYCIMPNHVHLICKIDESK